MGSSVVQGGGGETMSRAGVQVLRAGEGLVDWKRVGGAGRENPGVLLFVPVWGFVGTLSGKRTSRKTRQAFLGGRGGGGGGRHQKAVFPQPPGQELTWARLQRVTMTWKGAQGGDL